MSLWFTNASIVDNGISGTTANDKHTLQKQQRRGSFTTSAFTSIGCYENTQND